MKLVGRYIFSTSLGAFLALVSALTSVIWITQALRQIDLLTIKGQTFWLFLTLTGLIIPSLITIIAPFALFGAIIYVLNKLNGDSELIVMSAAGISPARLLVPFTILGVLATLLVASMSVYAMPWSFRLIQDIGTKVRADFLTRVVREGQFSTLDQGFVFHYRERGADGSLLGIFMQDRRDPQRITTYLAEAGQTLEANGQNYLVLEKGSVQRQQGASKDAAIVVFQRYAIDLAQFGASNDAASYKPRERSTEELMNLDLVNLSNLAPGKDEYLRRFPGRFRAELHERFAGPLYAIAASLIAFAVLGQARTTRQGRGLAIAAAVLLFSVLRVAGISAATLFVTSPSAIYLVYGLPIAASLASLGTIFWSSRAKYAPKTALPGPALKAAA